MSKCARNAGVGGAPICVYRKIERHLESKSLRLNKKQGLD